MRKLRFQYHMQLNFESPAREHHFTLRCMPVQDERQSIVKEQIAIYPKHYSSTQVDSFGNRCMYGTTKEEHTCFAVDVKGEAVVDHTRFIEAPSHKVGLYRYQTRLTEPGPYLNTFHECMSVMLEQMNSPLKKAQLMMEFLYYSYRYTPGVTGVNTTAEEACRLQAGVCQDYAHMMLSLCRKEKIPCRYVAGMMLGEGATHAWIEVYADGRWIPLDPTHNRAVDDTYIKISAGRDAQDCTINQGVFMGGGKQQQEINVIVEEI
ncbi:MAG: transglutaminase family protein [Lachnospiraceae bacterium]|nr:transglutaminase family protein [Lachnospiraceae bacterium]